MSRSTNVKLGIDLSTLNEPWMTQITKFKVPWLSSWSVYQAVSLVFYYENFNQIQGV